MQPPEFRKHTPRTPQSNKLVEELNRLGLPNLKSIDFYHVRVRHATKQEGIDAAAAALKVKPDIIQLEMSSYNETEVLQYQNYILGRLPTGHIPFFMTDFLDGFLGACKDFVIKNPNYVPIVVCAEGSGDDTAYLKLRGNIWDAYDRIKELDRRIVRELEPEDYEDFLGIYKVTIEGLLLSQRRREDIILSNLAARVADSSLVDTVKSYTCIKITSIYGASHGRLSSLFLEKGTNVFSKALYPLSGPNDSLFRLAQRGQPISLQDCEESILSVVAVVLLREDARYNSADKRKKDVLAWRALRKVLAKYGSPRAAFTAFCEDGSRAGSGQFKNIVNSAISSS